MDVESLVSQEESRSSEDDFQAQTAPVGMSQSWPFCLPELERVQRFNANRLFLQGVLGALRST